MARKGNRKSGNRHGRGPRIYLGEPTGAPRRKNSSYEWAAAAWVATVLLLALVALVWLSVSHPSAPPPTLIAR